MSERGQEQGASKGCGVERAQQVQPSGEREKELARDGRSRCLNPHEAGGRPRRRNKKHLGIGGVGARRARRARTRARRRA